MAKTYYTLIVWDTTAQAWFDEFGSYKGAEVREEYDGLDIPRKHKRIISHADTAQAMMALRDSIPAPK